MQEMTDLVCAECGSSMLVIVNVAYRGCDNECPTMPGVVCILLPHGPDRLHFGYEGTTDYQWD